MLSEILVVLLTLLSAIISAIAQYFYKTGVHGLEISKGNLHNLINRKTILGLVIYVVALGIYLLALGSGELSFVYPTFASTFVFVLLISHFQLREKIGSKRIAGILLIIIGIVLVALTY